MVKLSPHFARREFACNCGCGFDTADYELVMVLEKLREHFNQPVFINSGCRCNEYNEKIGGAKNSQHLYGRAADVVVRDVKPKDVYAWLDATYSHSLGLGKYNGWVHVDTRTDGPARW